MTTNQKWLLGVVVAFIVLGGFIIFAAAAISMMGQGGGGLAGSFGERVALVEVDGVIESAEKTVRQLDKLSEDDNIRAVVLRVNSPGGGVAPSQEIYAAIKALREETGKPVVVSMSSIAASGGYYISCAADSIIAAPGTITGSIGVILQFPNLDTVMSRIGIHMEVVKSAKHKDIGSPFRPLTDEERSILEEMVGDVYEQFVEVVTADRPLERDSVLTLADGRIYSGRQALEAGLVDRTGTLQDALDTAGRMCGLGDDPKIAQVREKKPSWFELINDTAARLERGGAALTSPRIMYLFQ